MIRALVFDFDGLILDTETALIDAYGDVHAAHGLPFDRAAFVRSVGHADYAFDPWRAFGREADRAGLGTEKDQFNRLRTRERPILPGVLELLDAGRRAGLRIGMASNSDHGHVDRLLKERGLFDRFEVVACREDVPSPKPEPDLYKRVIGLFGLAGREGVAFEDSHTGSLAASRAGLRVVAVPNVSTRHHDFSHADLQVGSLADIDLGLLIKRLG